MVCSIGGGKMGIMAKLLEAQSLPQNTGEEAVNKKLTARYICSELRKADEANLLDEEDMNVFGLKPMAEPLHLVCCNFCKKPIKASQFAAHAERCRSLSTQKKVSVELDCGTNRRKPPRKERKKILSADRNLAIPVGREPKCQLKNTSANTISEPNIDIQAGMNVSAKDAKWNVSGVHNATKMVGSAVIPVNTDTSACPTPTPIKRFKWVAVEHTFLPDDVERASGITTNLGSQTIGTSISRRCEVSGEATADCSAVGYNNSTRQINNRCSASKDVPAPLATKIYYSQTNNHFKSALENLFREAEARNMAPQSLQNDMIQSTPSSQRGSSLQRLENIPIIQQEPSALKAGQVPTPISNAYLSASRGGPSANNL